MSHFAVSGTDARGCAVTGATPVALHAYERALATSQTWRSGAEGHLEIALREAPTFVMGHVLQAWLLVCSRDPRRVRSARAVLARATSLPTNDRERMHVAAIAAALADDYELAKERLGELLRTHPRDVLGLQAVHSFDYVTGDIARMRDRVAAVLPAWSNALPGYSSVLAMHAFGLEESGQFERAEQVARLALALNPDDARAHHVMAHVFEMTERADEGVRWMNEHVATWGVESVAATHCAWHLGLFHVARDRIDIALALYDQRIRAGQSGELADLIDAAALLWRVELRSADTGARWAELADAWGAHSDDGYCSFSDVHAMLAFVGARDWERARRLERALTRSHALPTRHGATTRQLGLPACRALIAFGCGNDPLAVELLAALPARAHRLGGSHAQRDVLQQTLLCAAQRMRCAATALRLRRTIRLPSRIVPLIATSAR